MTTYRPGDHLRTPVDIAADEAERRAIAERGLIGWDPESRACYERHYADVIAEDLPYECPDCGEHHDGMATGTERCPDCENNSPDV